MKTVVVLLGLKWLFVLSLISNDDQTTMTFMPVLGFAGSPFVVLMIVAAFIDYKIISSMRDRIGSRAMLWVAISFAATFASGWVDIILGSIFMERSDSGNQLYDAFADQGTIYMEQGLPIMVEVGLSFVHLIFDVAWHLILLTGALRYCASSGGDT